jgi:hypothetical protein
VLARLAGEPKIVGFQPYKQRAEETSPHIQFSVFAGVGKVNLHLEILHELLPKSQEDNFENSA